MIKIIEKREEDINALQHLFFKTRTITFSWTDISKFKLSDFEKETENEYVLVALADEVLIGFVSVWVADSFIHHLYVDEAFRNQSVGTRLLNAVIEKIGLPVSLKCEEKNTEAVCFYRKKGFIEKERGESEIGTYILFELNKIAE